MIAQYVAASHPVRVRSLALLATSPAFGLDGTKPEEWRAARLAPLDAGRQPADFADDVLTAIAGPHISDGGDGRATGSHGAHLRRQRCATRSSAWSPTTAGQCCRRSPPRRCAWSAISTRRRRWPTAFALADLIPNATLAVIPMAGHLLNVEAPEAVNRCSRN